MDKKKFLDLKVYTNKKNGQQTVILPKKIYSKAGKKIPKIVRVELKW